MLLLLSLHASSWENIDVFFQRSESQGISQNWQMDGLVLCEKVAAWKYSILCVYLVFRFLTQSETNSLNQFLNDPFLRRECYNNTAEVNLQYKHPGDYKIIHKTDLQTHKNTAKIKKNAKQPEHNNSWIFTPLAVLLCLVDCHWVIQSTPRHLSCTLSYTATLLFHILRQWAKEGKKWP